MPMYKCDYEGCDKYFSSKAKLKQHKKRVHGIADDGAAPTGQGGGDGLTIKKPPERKPAEQEQTYFCQTCGHEPISKGTAECPECGEPLSWEGVE